MFAYSLKPMRRWAALAFAALLLAFAAFLLAFSVLFLDARVMAAGGLHAQAAESTYYVDCRAPAGGDGSRTEPWNTLTTVNAHTFVPGDRILFRRNTGCRGSLAPKGSGAEGSPIVVDAYGTGAKPLIAGAGSADAVYLYNQQYWEIRNLKVTNTGKTAGNRRGVHIVLKDFGTGSHYRVSNVTVHDVNGDNTKDTEGSAGIQLDVLKGSADVRTRFDDVVLDGNEVYKTDRSGINMSSQWKCRASIGCNEADTYVPWTNVIVRNNTVHDIGGDGIVMQYTEKGLAEYNVVYDINMRSNTNNAGIWVWNADHVTFQYNEAYRVRRPDGTNDGMAFDADYGTDGTLYQYNYSHDNEGGMMMYCGCGEGTSSTKNAVARYNVSVNDRSRVIMAAGVDNGSFYNNTIYLAKGSTTNIVEEYSAKSELDISNNIFSNEGTGGYQYPAPNAGHYTFRNNLFYGNHPVNEPDDPAKVTADPKFVLPRAAGSGLAAADGFRIRAGSPAIGKGHSVADNGGRDYWGHPVPDTCAPDIGAHQYSTCASQSSPDAMLPPRDTTCWYAWRIPPGYSRLRVSTPALCCGRTFGAGKGCAGHPFTMPWCGR